MTLEIWNHQHENMTHSSEIAIDTQNCRVWVEMISKPLSDFGERPDLEKYSVFTSPQLMPNFAPKKTTTFMFDSYNAAHAAAATNHANVAPATKSYAPTSPQLYGSNITKCCSCTYSDTATKPNAALTTKRQGPTSPNVATKNWNSNIITCSTCHEKRHSSITKYCTCHKSDTPASPKSDTSASPNLLTSTFCACHEKSQTRTSPWSDDHI